MTAGFKDSTEHLSPMHLALATRRGSLAAAGATLLIGLTGCAGPRDVLLADGKKLEAAPANFKLTDVRVRWQGNPNLPYSSQTAVPKHAKEFPQEAKARAAADMKIIQSLFSAHWVEDMTAALATRGVRAGTRQTLLLYPKLGYWDDTGWGSGLTMSVTVTDETTQQRWVDTINADGGLQWLGARHAGPPERKIVQGFASGLLNRFKTAGLI